MSLLPRNKQLPHTAKSAITFFSSLPASLLDEINSNPTPFFPIIPSAPRPPIASFSFVEIYSALLANQHIRIGWRQKKKNYTPTASVPHRRPGAHYFRAPNFKFQRQKGEVTTQKLSNGFQSITTFERTNLVFFCRPTHPVNPAVRKCQLLHKMNISFR